MSMFLFDWYIVAIWSCSELDNFERELLRNGPRTNL